MNVCIWLQAHCVIGFLIFHYYLLPFSAPSGAPEKFQAVVGQRKVAFSWSPPPVLQQNGHITSYTLSCSPSTFSLPQSLLLSAPLTVAGFSPGTPYSCSVVASNSQGSGPPAHANFTTLQDCKTNSTLLFFFSCALTSFHIWADSFFQLRLSGMVACSELIVSML